MYEGVMKTQTLSTEHLKVSQHWTHTELAYMHANHSSHINTHYFYITL